MKWLDAQSACALLGIKPASLYAYVSRGKVRARSGDADPRASQYSASDIEHLLARNRAGRKRDSIARGAIGWGEPILESAITCVHSGRLIFRGWDAIGLSQNATWEEVAALLCNIPRFPDIVPSCVAVLEGDPKSAGLNYLARMTATGFPTAKRSHTDLIQDAAVLMNGFSHAMALGSAGRGAHEKLATLWGLNTQQGQILRRALVLLADHELNPSTFAARIAASTGASLAACSLAGLTTLTGPYHGEAALMALDFLIDAHKVGPQSAVNVRLESSQNLAGFGHKLYPDGDPRAKALLDALQPFPLLKETISYAEASFGAQANIDMVLAILTLQLNLPRSAPFTLFAVARMAGWLAHAIEQSGTHSLIRPRARYVGVRWKGA